MNGRFTWNTFLGDDKGIQVIWLIKLGNNNAAAGTGGMNHFAVAHINAHMTDVPPSPAEKSRSPASILEKSIWEVMVFPQLACSLLHRGRSTIKFWQTYCTKPEQSVAELVSKIGPPSVIAAFIAFCQGEKQFRENSIWG